MSKHPYPEHVVESVAEALARQRGYTLQYSELNSYHQNYLANDARAVLQALWDAGRVDTLQQVDQLADDVILWGADDMEHDKFTLHVADINNELSKALPAHVIYWGDSDA